MFFSLYFGYLSTPLLTIVSGQFLCNRSSFRLCVILLYFVKFKYRRSGIILGSPPP